MSYSNCCFLTHIQISQEAGKVAWYSHSWRIFHNLLWFTQSKALASSAKQKYMISSNYLVFFYDPMDVDNLISGPSPFSKCSLNIWKFLVHGLLKPSLENFEHYFTSVWDDCNCVVVWAFFGIAFLRDWNENWPFPVLWPLLCFPKCWRIEWSISTASYFRIWNNSLEFHHFH